jgi:hypothetical protein
METPHLLDLVFCGLGKTLRQSVIGGQAALLCRTGDGSDETTEHRRNRDGDDDDRQKDLDERVAIFA